MAAKSSGPRRSYRLVGDPELNPKFKKPEYRFFDPTQVHTSLPQRMEARFLLHSSATAASLQPPPSMQPLLPVELSAICRHRRQRVRWHR